MFIQFSKILQQGSVMTYGIYFELRVLVYITKDVHDVVINNIHLFEDL